MPPIRRKPRSPYAKAVLGVRVRTGPTVPRELKLTDYRATLLDAIAAGHIHAGRGTYTGGWRWHQPHGQAITVTNRVNELLAAGWARRNGPGLEVTEAGRQAMERGE